MVLARMSIWCFKKGKREEAFAELDRILSSLSQNVTGFRGYMSLLSKEDLTAAVVLTIWQDEEALEASEKGVFADAIKKVQGLLETTPRIENYKVYSTELFQHFK
ncbi:MAG TPA: antibiotic biosynthesis monooxygenase family protein [Candidatus Nanoarchaeia archaeon]|nr:antibiotic biosynthesis monooxygenase family protein [Candidatus Nanoarchaeia archaeon]